MQIVWLEKPKQIVHLIVPVNTSDRHETNLQCKTEYYKFHLIVLLLIFQNLNFLCLMYRS